MTTTRASGPPARRDEARQDLALSQLVLGAADDQQVPGAWPAGAARWEACRAQHTASPDGIQPVAILAGCAAERRHPPRSATTTRCWAPNRRPRPPSCAPPSARRSFATIPTAPPPAELATRRTAVLNRAWRELRDPLRRLHYDHDLERGTAATLAWPLEADETPAPRDGAASRGRAAADEPRGTSPSGATWRASASRPTSSWPARAPRTRWIVEQPHHRRGLARPHRALLAALCGGHYRDRGRIEDWIGAHERRSSSDPPFERDRRADLRDAYLAAGE